MQRWGAWAGVAFTQQAGTGKMFPQAGSARLFHGEGQEGSAMISFDPNRRADRGSPDEEKGGSTAVQPACVQLLPALI